MVVKNTAIQVPVRVAKTKNFVFEDGERACIIVDLDGMPLFYPNLFLTTHARNRSLSSSSVTNIAGHLCAFLQAMEEARIDLLSRLPAGYILEPYEVEALRGDLQRPLLVESQGKGFPTYFSQDRYISKEILHARVGVTTQYLEFLAKNFLRNTRDSKELERLYSALKDIRPIYKKRNTIKRKKGLDEITVAAIVEVMTPGSEYNVWSDEGLQVRNRLLLALMYELGIRRGELLNIKIEDINFGSGNLSVVRRADEKDDPRVFQPLAKTNDRDLPIKASTLKELQLYIANYRRHVPGAKKHGFLFVTHKPGKSQGQPISLSGYKDIIKSLREAVPPLSDFTGHDLRHNWNDRFSNLMERAEISPAEEELMRSMLMGWKFGSGTAATYNTRYIERRAARFGMKMQEESIRPVMKGAK